MSGCLYRKDSSMLHCCKKKEECDSIILFENLEMLDACREIHREWNRVHAWDE